MPTLKGGCFCPRYLMNETLTFLLLGEAILRRQTGSRPLEPRRFLGQKSRYPSWPVVGAHHVGDGSRLAI